MVEKKWCPKYGSLTPWLTSSFGAQRKNVRCNNLLCVYIPV